MESGNAHSTVSQRDSSNLGAISLRSNEGEISNRVATLFFCGSGMTVGVPLAGRRKWENRK